MRSHSLSSLRFKHDGSTDPEARSNIRCQARYLARKQGLPCPAWAAKRKRGEAEPVVDPAPPMPDPMPEISSALRAWRSAVPGRVINTRRDGTVILIQFEGGTARKEAKFADARTAERALLLGVSWRAVAKVDSRPRTASGRVRQHSAVG